MAIDAFYTCILLQFKIVNDEIYNHQSVKKEER